MQSGRPKLDPLPKLPQRKAGSNMNSLDTTNQAALAAAGHHLPPRPHAQRRLLRPLNYVPRRSNRNSSVSGQTPDELKRLRGNRFKDMYNTLDTPTKQVAGNRSSSLGGRLALTVIKANQDIGHPNPGVQLPASYLNSGTNRAKNETPQLGMASMTEDKNQQERSFASSEAPRDLKQLEKFMVNLEDVILQEDKLWCVLEGMRGGIDISMFCQDWWEVTEATTIASIERLFRDQKTKNAIRVSRVLETIAVGICNYVAGDLRTNQALASNCRTLMFWVHQSFMVIIAYILYRMPNESNQNMWVFSLHNILANKRSKKFMKSDNFSILKQCNDQIANVIRNIARSKPHKLIYTTANNILRQADKIQLLKTRKMLINTLRNAPTSFSAMHRSSGIGGSMNQPYFTASGAALLGPDGDPLPEVHPPFLPKLEGENTNEIYTLALDLDETLVHYFEMGTEGHFLVRPGCSKFLDQMAKHYEVIIFTAAMQDYADWVLDQIDPNKRISYRLYRQHASPQGTTFIKDLSKLGRDLNKVIIVDNVAENFQLQPDNGIFIKSWFEDMSDTALEELAPLLKEIVVKKVKDVRKALRHFRDQMMRHIAAGELRPHLNLQLQDESSPTPQSEGPLE